VQYTLSSILNFAPDTATKLLCINPHAQHFLPLAFLSRDGVDLRLRCQLSPIATLMRILDFRRKDRGVRSVKRCWSILGAWLLV